MRISNLFAIGNLISQVCCNLTYGQTNPPPITVPARKIFTNDSVKIMVDASMRPGSPAGTGGGAGETSSPAATTQFTAIVTDTDLQPLLIAPPDTMGTVGRSSVLSMLNQGAMIQSKNGDIVYSTNSLIGFWAHPNIAASNLGTVNNAFDPRTTYDPFHDRWIATCLVDATFTNTCGILIGVSLSANPHPTNGWHSLRVAVDTNQFYWLDQPTLGFNKDWIVVQGNMQANGVSGVQASYFFVFNKTNLYARGTNVVRLFHNDAERAGNERPALTYDNSLDELYLIQNADGNYNNVGGRLRLFSISGAVDDPKLNYLESSNAVYINVANSTSESGQI